MTNLEDRPRHDFGPISERAQLGPVRPFHAPHAGRWSRAVRWLVPLTATAAVIGMLAGPSLAAGATVSRPVSARAQAGVPKYYVALTTIRPITDFRMRGSSTINWPELLGKANTVATVRATETSRVLARLRPPAPYLNFIAVSAAASDRTFVLLAEGPGAEHLSAPQRFYLLRINPGAASRAKRAQLTALPASYLPGLSPVQAMALSPNGGSLAVALRFPGKLSVINLTTGKVRTSPTSVGTPLVEFLPHVFTLSWAPNGKSLALNPPAMSTGRRLLRLSTPGGDIRPYGKPIAIHVTGLALRQWSVSGIAPDGKTAFINYVTTRRHTIWVSLARFSPRTGRLTTVNNVMIENHGHGTGHSYYGEMLPDEPFWTNDTGQLAIVGYVRSGQTGGSYQGSTFTPIPWPASLIGAAW